MKAQAGGRSCWRRANDFLREADAQWMTICLGLTSMANAVAYSGPVDLRPVAAGFTLTVMVLMAWRALYTPGLAAKELGTLGGLAAYQTGIMAAYFMCVQLESLHPALARGLWSAAFAGNLAVIAVFFQRQVRDGFALRKVTPVWYLIFLGIAVAAITGASMGYGRLAWGVAVYSAVFYFVLTPLILLRLVSYPLPEKERPTEAIMCAAPSVVLMSLLAGLPKVAPGLAVVLFLLSQGFLFWLYAQAGRFRRLPFTVTFASFTFPAGISVLTIFAFRDLYVPTAGPAYSLLTLVGYGELTLACGVVLGVVALFVRHSVRLWRRINRQG